VPILYVNLRRGCCRQYYKNPRHLQGLSCCWCCCCVADCRLHTYTGMSFTNARLLQITVHKMAKFDAALLSPMLFKYWVVNMQTSALPGWIFPMYIRRGGNIWLIPKVTFEEFLFKSSSKYGLDTLEVVQLFGFNNNARCSSKVKPIWTGQTNTFILVRSNRVIDGYSDRYSLR